MQPDAAALTSVPHTMDGSRDNYSASAPQPAGGSMKNPVDSAGRESFVAREFYSRAPAVMQTPPPAFQARIEERGANRGRIGVSRGVNIRRKVCLLLGAIRRVEQA